MKLSYNEENHAYWLDGKRCKSITTVASIPDNRWNLERWNERMVAIGVVIDDMLRESIAAHHDDKDKLNDLCEQAKQVAKAHEGRDRGINVHKITERVDTGVYVIPTPLAEGIMGDYAAVITACGLTILPEYVERIVVYPDLRLAGRFDNIMQTTDGRLVIVDKKGGASAIDYPHSIAIQLALYANAPLMADRLVRRGKSGVSERFGPLPDVDKESAIVIHLPDEGPARGVEVDIAKGWHTAEQLCFGVLAWRDETDLIRPIRVTQPFAVTEGQPLSDKRLAELRELYSVLADAKPQVDRWMVEGRDNGRPWAVKEPHGRPTERRYWIARAAMAWSATEDIARQVLALVLGEDVQGTTGAAFGSLTIEQARRVAELADGGVTANIDDDGRVRLSLSEGPPEAA